MTKKTLQSVTHNAAAVITNREHVRVIFTGILVLRFDDDKGACKVGILPVKNHRLRLTVELRNSSDDTVRPDEEGMPLPKNQELPLKRDFFVSVHKPDKKSARVARFQVKGTLDRDKVVQNNNPQFSPIEMPEEKDYRWALHLGWFHEKEYMFRDRALSSHIKLTNGIFYAEKLSGPAKIWVSRLIGEKPIPLTSKAIDAGVKYRANWREGLEIHYIAQEIGAKVYFGAKDSEFRLVCSAKGKPIPSLPLKLKKPPSGCYYAVIFNNDCRFRNEENGEEKCTVTVNGKEYSGDECKSDLPLYYNKDLLLDNLKEEDILDFKLDDNGVDCPCSPDSEPS